MFLGGGGEGGVHLRLAAQTQGPRLSVLGFTVWVVHATLCNMGVYENRGK